MILIAFAVHMAPVSDRSGLPGLRVAERLALLDGALAGLWLGDCRIGDEACARVGPKTPAWAIARLGQATSGRAPLDRIDALAQVGPVLLPTPPPAAA